MRKGTGKLIAASPSVCADVLYAGGFNAPDEVLYFETGREKGLILSQLEYARGREEARKTVRVWSRETFLEDDQEDRSDRAVLLNLSRRFGVTEWSVPASFPLLTADFLRSNGVGVTAAGGEFFIRISIENRGGTPGDCKGGGCDGRVHALCAGSDPAGASQFARFSDAWRTGVHL